MTEAGLVPTCAPGLADALGLGLGMPWAWGWVWPRGREVGEGR